MAKRSTTTANDLTDSATVDPDAALFPKLKQWVRDSLDQHSDWYTEAKECFGFTSGRGVKGEGQWPGNSWQEMLDSGRQPVEFNRVGPIVDSICGLEINNRQDVKYLPRTQGDSEVNERLSSLGDWAREETNAEDEESEMFRNAVICGRGATETRIDFSEEPTGKIVVDNLDPLECGVDPAARKAALSDRRYSWRFKDLPTSEAQSMFEGVEPSALNAAWAASISTKDGGEGNKTDYPDETRPALKDTRAPKTVRIVQIEWWEQTTSYLVAVPGTDGTQEIGEEAFATLQDEIAKLPDDQQPQTQKLQRRRYRKAFLGRAGILDVSDIACFQINWTTGRYDRNKGYHYGVVRPMRDPQMLSNKTLSQVLHILNSNAKGGLWIEAGAFRNPKDAEKDHSNPAKTVVLNDGGIAKIKERTAPPLPESLVHLQEFSLSSIRDVTGVSVEMLGLADRDQPASLEYQRRQSAMVILASLFNGLRTYRKGQGLTMAEQLKLLPPGVLVRVLIDPKQAAMQFAGALAQWMAAVTGQPQMPPMQPPSLEQCQQMYQSAMQLWQTVAQGAQAQGQQPPPPPPKCPTDEFLKTTKVGQEYDPAAFGLGPDARFDVIVDETPSSPNQKEATWAALQPFMTELAANPAAMKVALEYSPLPETAASELAEALSGGNGPQIPPEVQKTIQQGQQMLQQLTQENAALKLKLQEASSNNDADMLNAQSKAQDADTKRIKAISEIAQPNDIEELKQHVAVLGGAVSKIIKAMGGNDVENQG